MSVRFGLAIVAALGALGVSGALGLAGCKTGPAVTSGDDGAGKVDCKRVTPPLEPELLLWDPHARAELDRARRQGVVAVRYEGTGCDVSLELVPRCVGPKDRYVYTAASSSLGKALQREDELFASFPLGAGANASKLGGGNVIRADAQVVGVLAFAPGVTVGEYDLVGPECKRATHIVSALHVGGFGVSAGAKNVVAGANAFSKPVVDPFVREGYSAACERATADGKETSGCAVPIRVVLQPIGAGVIGAATAPAVAPAPPPASAPPPPVATSDAGVGDVFDQNAIERVVREHQGPLRRKCWEPAPTTLRRLTLNVTLAVETPGKVTSATPNVTDSEGASDVANATAKCIASDVASWRFPDPESRKVLTLPFHFMRQ